jgi:hypothetical protein
MKFLLSAYLENVFALLGAGVVLSRLLTIMFKPRKSEITFTVLWRGEKKMVLYEEDEEGEESEDEEGEEDEW